MPAELPDDHRQWPADPFALLGVARGAADAEVRRAYVKLIRRFKPEHHPEPFRLIRDAYETCRIQTAWYRTDDADAPGDPEPAAPAPDSPDEPFVAVRRAADPEPAPPPRRDPVAEHWERLADGPDADAFAGLLAAADAEPERADLSLRLYWLLAFHPTLDPERSRHHWLARALHQSRLRGAAAELYRRELEANPAAALDGPYRDLLADAEADAGAVAAVAHARLAAAGRASLFGRMAEDLSAVRRLRFDDEPAWLGLLVEADSWAAWTPPNPALDRVVEELAGLRHLELRHSWSFDRIDAVRAAAASVRWDALPPAVFALFRSSTAAHGHVAPEDVEAAAVAVAVHPIEAWHTLDAASRGAVRDALAAAFEGYRNRFQDDDAEYPAPLIRAAAARLRPFAVHGYGRWRPHLLRFLLDERIDPAEFTDAFRDDPSAFRSLAERVAADASLRAVWLAVRIAEG